MLNFRGVPVVATNIKWFSTDTPYHIQSTWSKMIVKLCETYIYIYYIYVYEYYNLDLSSFISCCADIRHMHFIPFPDIWIQHTSVGSVWQAGTCTWQWRTQSVGSLIEPFPSMHQEVGVLWSHNMSICGHDDRRFWWASTTYTCIRWFC